MLHADRQAICRCPRCLKFFCRECVVEHELQYVCSACLSRAVAPIKKQSSAFTNALFPALGGIAFFGAWFFFYSVGRWLLQ